MAWTTGTSSLTGLMWGGGIAGPEWTRRGIPPVAARVWQLLGIEADQAARHAAAGVDPLAVVEDYWRAGVPLDEAAQWLAAGFSGADAARARDAGTSADAVATYAALRTLGT
jgi:hypothetical protein